MQIVKDDKAWLVRVEDQDNQMGLVNMLRSLEKLNGDISEENVDDLMLSIDLRELRRANSELIAQFVMLQSNLVRNNGRLNIVNANLELKGAFDVVMLDKIINIQYEGLDESESSSEEE